MHWPERAAGSQTFQDTLSVFPPARLKVASSAIQHHQKYSQQKAGMWGKPTWWLVRAEDSAFWWSCFSSSNRPCKWSICNVQDSHHIQSHMMYSPFSHTGLSQNSSQHCLTWSGYEGAVGRHGSCPCSISKRLTWWSRSSKLLWKVSSCCCIGCNRSRRWRTCPCNRLISSVLPSCCSQWAETCTEEKTYGCVNSHTILLRIILHTSKHMHHAEQFLQYGGGREQLHVHTIQYPLNEQATTNSAIKQHKGAVRWCQCGEVFQYKMLAFGMISSPGLTPKSHCSSVYTDHIK